MDAFTAGFYLGNLAYRGVVALAFWFVGRWGWFGLLIRIVCARLCIIRAVNLLAYMTQSA
ncbi:MAG TPA: hypothetical protein VND96_08550 [Candidatus Micrarchaeaceae archaeon]|nr:hypothetical protein [Candidatus Micrarchaeaceae archaeon]